VGRVYGRRPGLGLDAGPAARQPAQEPTTSAEQAGQPAQEPTTSASSSSTSAGGAASNPADPSSPASNGRRVKPARAAINPPAAWSHNLTPRS